MSETSSNPTQQPPTYGRWMGTMWLFTVLRFGLFFVLWGILLLIGIDALVAALIALVLSVPLSLVLLAKPRHAFTAQLEARVDAQRRRKSELSTQLDPDATDPLDPEGHNR